jgi:Na+/proline symporter
MSGLHPVDFVVLGAYLVGITLFGALSGRGSKSTGDFFMPRRFGKMMMLLNAFGTGTASDQAVSVASGTARNGISGIWYQWSWLFATPFYWLIAPLFRRFRAVTTADVYTLRFDRSVAGLFAAVGIVSLAVKTGVLLKGTGALVEACTDNRLDAHYAIPMIAFLFVFYGIVGGLTGAISTDAVEGVMTLLFSFMLLPFVLSAVGGIGGIKATIQDEHMLSLVAPGKVTAFFIIMMAIQLLVGIVAQPFVMGVCGAGKTEYEGRVGMMFGNFLKRICTIAWCVTAISGVAWYLQNGKAIGDINPDNLYGDLASDFLPKLMPGALGLFVASMLAGVMSSCSAFMLSSAALFTQNVYRPLVVGQDEAHYLRVGRITSVLVVCGGILFAFWVPNVIKALEIWFMIAPMMGITFWIGLFWRPFTPLGAWASTLAGFGTWWITTLPSVVDWVAGHSLATSWRLVWEENGKNSIYLPWQIMAYMSVAIVAGVVVSGFSKPVAKEQLDRFYRLIRTPVQPGEKILAPCTVPVESEGFERALIVSRFGLEIPRLSKLSIQGFLLGWVCVALLIGGFWLIWQ